MSTILEQVKQSYVRDLVASGKREDDRGLMDYRPIHVDKGFAPNAEGSCMAHIGNTKILCGIKFDVMTPFADRPTEGVVMANCEFAPLAHPEFHPGPPNENSIEVARVVDRGIRSAKVVDVENMLLEEGKVLGLFIDLYVLDHDGNLIDTAALAAMGALQNARVPKFENGKLVRGEYAGSLKLAHTVVSTSFEKFGDKILVDANFTEEVASKGRLSLGTADGEFVVSSQKSGEAGFSQKEYMDLIDAAFLKHKELAAALDKVK
jgi:exosome complex component RRP42